MSPSIKNVSIKDFKKFLLHYGLTQIRSEGGHEIWCGKTLTRPVVFQTHIDPIPLFIIKSNLRTMNLTLKDLRNFLEPHN
jgi:hypothetical protein